MMRANWPPQKERLPRSQAGYEAELTNNHSQMEVVRNQLPPHHTYQNALGRLGLAGLIYCGPAAVTESLAFLKWNRSPNFPLLKWAGENPKGPVSDSDDYMYRQTLDLVELFKTNPWQIPFFNPLYTDSVAVVKGLRSYFKDSGYPQPWVFAQGYRAFDAPPGKSLSDMEKPALFLKSENIPRMVMESFYLLAITIVLEKPNAVTVDITSACSAMITIRHGAKIEPTSSLPTACLFLKSSLAEFHSA